jgi:alpha-glucosidase (family GH31 glycosyl hydrolase)
MVRPVALEYPDDPAALHDDVRYEFLCGDAFLVAPVCEDADVRNRIYLPAGTWFDFWTGEPHRGPVWIDGYPAPLERLPLFVKGGSIVPLWPDGTLSWAGRDTSRLDLDIWPEGHTAFDLYEDDGVTRQYADGRFAWQRFAVEAGGAGSDVAVTLGPSVGEYDGKPERRRYRVRLLGGGPPVVAETPPIPTGEAFRLTIPRASTPAG